MGIRQNYAVCGECEKHQCPKCQHGFDSYTFGITLEWMNKERLLEHIKNQVCPCCGSHNWSLTDVSDI